MEDDVSKDREGRLEIAAERGPGQRGVQGLSTLGVTDSQIIERREQLSAVARTGAAHDPFRGHRGGAAAVQSDSALIRGPRGKQEREGRRLDARHRLGEQNQTIGVLLLLDR